MYGHCVIGVKSNRRCTFLCVTPPFRQYCFRLFVRDCSRSTLTNVLLAIRRLFNSRAGSSSIAIESSSERGISSLLTRVVHKIAPVSRAAANLSGRTRKTIDRDGDGENDTGEKFCSARDRSFRIRTENAWRAHPTKILGRITMGQTKRSAYTCCVRSSLHKNIVFIRTFFPSIGPGLFVFSHYMFYWQREIVVYIYIRLYCIYIIYNCCSEFNFLNCSTLFRSHRNGYPVNITRCNVEK